MNTHITVKNKELFSCDEKGENMVPFRQESYVVDDTAIKIYKPFENLVLNNFKEGEIYRCPEGFMIEICNLPESELKTHSDCMVQYAKLVPIKEQKKETIREDLLKVFEAGKKCMEEHPDDDTYDDIHFERVLKTLSNELIKQIGE